MTNNVIFLALTMAASSYAATWNGQISDSACGTSHAKMMAEHKGMKTDRACTLACVKGGSKYVLVSDGKVFNISNQRLAGLSKYAGESVQVTGTLKEDTITVTKLRPKK